MSILVSWKFDNDIDLMKLNSPIELPNITGDLSQSRYNLLDTDFNRELTCNVSIEDYSATSIAVTVYVASNTSLNSGHSAKLTIYSNHISIPNQNGTYAILTLTLDNIRIDPTDSGQIWSSYITTFIIKKYSKDGLYYPPMIYGISKYTNDELEGELRTFTEHHHPTQIDNDTRYNVYCNDNQEEYETYMLGCKLNAQNIKTVDLTKDSIDLDLPNNNASTSSIYKSSIGLSLSSNIDNYIDRNILEEDRYTSKLAIERIIFMSNRINVLGNTIKEIKTPSIVKDEYLLSSNMLEPSNDEELRKLSAIKPDKLANFFVGTKRIDSEEMYLESVVSFLEIYDKLEYSSVKIHLLAEEDVLVITNHYHVDGTAGTDGTDIQLYYNNELIDTVHIKLGNCDSVYVNLNNDPKVSQYHITEQCTSTHYDAVIRTVHELEELADTNGKYKDNHSVLIKKNEDEDHGGMYFLSSNITLPGTIHTIALDSDVYIVSNDLIVDSRTNLINYRGYGYHRPSDVSAHYNNGNLYYVPSKYDIVISSNSQLLEFVSTTSPSTQYADKIIYLDICKDDGILYGIYQDISSVLTSKKTIICRALYMNSHVDIEGTAGIQYLYIQPSKDCIGYINVNVNGFNCGGGSDLKSIAGVMSSITGNSFSGSSKYYNTTSWSIKPYGSDTTYSGIWMIEFTDISSITNNYGYYKLSKITGGSADSRIILYSKGSLDTKLSSLTWYAAVGSYE